MVERQGIVVWFQHMKNVRQLKNMVILFTYLKSIAMRLFTLIARILMLLRKNLISLLLFLKWNVLKSRLFRQTMKTRSRIKRSNTIIKWEFKQDV